MFLLVFNRVAVKGQKNKPEHQKSTSGLGKKSGRTETNWGFKNLLTFSSFNAILFYRIEINIPKSNPYYSHKENGLVPYWRLF
jgi:hypothetical protein